MQLHATQSEPKLEDFTEWSSKELYRAADDREQIERWRRGKIDPSLSDAELTERLEKAPAPKKLAGLLRRLADEKTARSTGPIYSFEWRDDKLVMRGRLSTTALPPNILLTDATASPIILQAVFPNHEIEFHQLNIHRNAYVTQVRDLTFSRNWLLRKKNLPRVVAFLKDLAARYPRLAIFTTKRIRCEMTGEDRKAGRLPLFALLPGTAARIGHYANLKGIDQFKDCDALVVLGREQPNVADLEDEMKALFYDAKEPLKFVKAIRMARTGVTERDYQAGRRPYLMRDRSVQSAEVQVHPDPRGQALLERPRESELIQSIDRGRLIHREGPPTPVFILCSIPLPGVEVDQLVTWKELTGPDWLRRCVDEVAAAGKNALPLSATWLATRFPELGGANAVKQALKHGRVFELLETQRCNDAVGDQPLDWGQIPNKEVYKRSDTNSEVVPNTSSETHKRVGAAPPPWFPGWHNVRFRVAKRAGREPSHALVRNGTDPAAAIAEVSGLSLEQILIITAPSVPSPAVDAHPSPDMAYSSPSET
jgi:hypothetical protein